jgi:hypothetical protein
MIKVLMELGIKGMYLNIIKAINDKLTTNIILNGERLKPFPLQSRIRKGGPLFLNIVLESLVRTMRQEEKIEEFK